MEICYNRHYITVDTQGQISHGWSDGPHPDRNTTNAICISEQGGYQFRLFPGGEENPLLYSIDGIPLYRWDGEKVAARSEDEMAEDQASISAPPPGEEEMKTIINSNAISTEGKQT